MSMITQLLLVYILLITLCRHKPKTLVNKNNKIYQERFCINIIKVTTTRTIMAKHLIRNKKITI